MAKSLLLTYILWLLGGFLGAHHIYLRRYKQAFIWWCFPGGYFGAGWFRDIWRIPEYVKDVNNDPNYLTMLSEKMREMPKPPIKIVRLLGQLVVGNMFGVLIKMAFPDKEDELGPGIDFDLITLLLSPAGAALGVWVVGNVGREKGGIGWPIAAAYLSSPLYIFYNFGFSVITLTSIVAFHWRSKSWRRQVDQPASFCKRITVLFLCCTLYSSLWTGYVFYNLRFTTTEGDEIRFRDAVGNLIKSPAFQEFSKNVGALYEHCLKHGFSSAWGQLIDSLDPLGERNALKVLELKKSATQSEIRSRYRELSKKWHPDKYLSEEDKEEANARFVEIQAAYEKLSDIKTKRSAINRRHEEE